MKEYKVEYTQEFGDKLQELCDYIRGHYGSPMDAARLANKIRQSCRNLAVFPKSSAVSVVCRGYEFRFLEVGHHTVIYTVDDENAIVTVWTLMYAQRDIARLLEEER